MMMYQNCERYPGDVVWVITVQETIFLLAKKRRAVWVVVPRIPPPGTELKKSCRSEKESFDEIGVHTMCHSGRTMEDGRSEDERFRNPALVF